MLEISDGSLGKEILAKTNISKGTILGDFIGSPYTKEEYIKNLDPDNCRFLQINEDTFLGPGESDYSTDFINHSCDPNCGVIIKEDIAFIVAIKDIKRGEEITFDYSTTMDEDHWEMSCQCGSPFCRKKIKDFKYLPDELKMKYILMGIVPQYIVEKYLRGQFIQCITTSQKERQYSLLFS